MSMPLMFDQRPLPDGVLHLLIDDGESVTHVFSERAPWHRVADAAALGSSEYARRFWQRCTTTESEVAVAAAPVTAHADAAVVYEKRGNTLALVASHGWTSDHLAGWESLPATCDFPTAAAVRTGRPYFYRNAAVMEEAHPGLRGATVGFFGSYLALPINDNGVALMAWRAELDVCQSQLLEMLGAAE